MGPFFSSFGKSKAKIQILAPQNGGINLVSFAREIYCVLLDDSVISCHQSSPLQGLEGLKFFFQALHSENVES